MFKKREALNRKQHANLRYSSGKRFGFAANAMSIPVLSAEATNIAREYVIVFDRDQAQLHALLGAYQDFNAYLTEQNQWLGRYIPALIRAYPFSPGVLPDPENSDGGHQLTVLIDPEAPHFQDASGQPVLDEHGNPSEFLIKVQETLRHLHHGMVLTTQLVNQLQQLNLLVERPLAITPLKVSIQGFRVIDTKQLNALTESEMVALRDSGALPLIYAHLISLSNINDSPIVRQPSAKPTEPEPATATDFFTDEDFNLDFSKFR